MENDTRREQREVVVDSIEVKDDKCEGWLEPYVPFTFVVWDPGVRRLPIKQKYIKL